MLMFILFHERFIASFIWLFTSSLIFVNHIHFTEPCSVCYPILLLTVTFIYEMKDFRDTNAANDCLKVMS